MNSIKYILSAISLISAIAGAFAFKKAANSSKTFFFFTKILGQRCTLSVTGYIYLINPPSGSVLTFYATINNSATCPAVGYFLATSI